VEELGIEPSSSQRELHAAILAQDPSLGTPARPRRPPRAKRRVAAAPAAVRRRPGVLAAAGAALVVGAVGIAALLIVGANAEPGRPAVPLTYSALAAIAPRTGIVEAAPALPGVGRVALTERRVWVGGDDSQTVSAVDARTRRQVLTVPLGMFPSDIAAGGGSVWVVDGAHGRVARIDASYGGIAETYRFKPTGDAPADRFGSDPTSIAADDDGAWITDGGARLLRAAGSSLESIPVGLPLVGVATAAGAVWAISGETAEVLRIDPRTRQVTMRLQTVDEPELESAFPIAIAATGDLVWVLNANTGSVTKIDPRTRSVLGTITVGIERAPTQLAADAAGLWVANEDGSLARVDAVTDEVVFYEVGRMLRDVAVGEGAVWATSRLGDCCGQEQ
jgi:DNA-binding beta-propeller fold protein YncE